MQFSHRAFGTPQSQANIMSGERKKKCKHGTKSSDHATCSFLIQTLTKQKDTRYNKKKKENNNKSSRYVSVRGTTTQLHPYSQSHFYFVGDIELFFLLLSRITVLTPKKKTIQHEKNHIYKNETETNIIGTLDTENADMMWPYINNINIYTPSERARMRKRA